MRLPFNGLYPLTQEFGVNPDYYKQFLVKYPDGTTKPMSGHNGLDFATPHRTEIVSPHDGQIIEATLDQNGYGYYVKIENDKEGSVLAHLDEINVQREWKVKEGDHIGWSDNTGYSTGPHLHWGWYKKPRNRANGIAGYEDQAVELRTLGYVIALGKNPVQTMPSGRLYTQSEYDAAMSDRNKFWKERDEALAKLNELIKEHEVMMGILTGFQAMGYNTVDDITKIHNEKDEDITGIKKQLIVVLRRNETLAKLLAEKDGEEAAALEMAESGLEELKKLREGMAEVTKATGAPEPSVREIVSKVDFFKGLAEKWLRKLEYEHKAKQEKPQKQSQKPPSVAQALTEIFNL